MDHLLKTYKSLHYVTFVTVQELFTPYIDYLQKIKKP